ncbi:MAG: DUF1232 domain-containing protein [Bacteroidales bacterium]|nr:DUF1232 domain-containing protein [Bacteroidales bacterium]
MKLDKFSLKTAPQYERHYNEEGFWRKVRRVAAQAGAKVLYPALQLFFLLQAKDVSVKAKTLIIGALGYLILPADLVPDFIPAMGFTDDLTALLIAIRTVSVYLTPDINRQAKEQTDKLLGKQ